MAKITEERRNELLSLTYDQGKARMYEILLELAVQTRILNEAKEKLELLNSEKDALYESILSKASEEEKAMKKIYSERMILQENSIVENKIDLAKIANLVKTSPVITAGFIKMLENKEITLSAPTKIVKKINAYAGSTVLSLDDIQSLQTKKEVLLTPIDITAADELE